MKLLNFNRIETVRFFSYIRDRNRIWAQKYLDGIEQDYNGDEVLTRYHFCNIWREQDKFSREEIRRMRGKSLRDQVKQICLSRFALSWSTFDILIQDDLNLADIYAHWEACRSGIVGDRFIGLAINFQPDRGSDRAKTLFHFRNQLIEHLDEIVDSIQRQVHRPIYLLSKFPAMFDKVGIFRAYELYTSLTYSEHLNLIEDAIFTVGPGAIAGLEMLVARRYSDVQGNAFLIDLSEEVKEYLIGCEWFRWIPPHLQGSVNYKEEHKFTVRTLEDCLCEFRKYVHITDKKSKHRRKYEKTAIGAEICVERRLELV